MLSMFIIYTDNHYLGYANMTRKNWEQIDKYHMPKYNKILVLLARHNIFL